MFDLRAIIILFAATRGCIRPRSGRPSLPDPSNARPRCERSLLVFIRSSLPSNARIRSINSIPWSYELPRGQVHGALLRAFWVRKSRCPCGCRAPSPSQKEGLRSGDTGKVSIGNRQTFGTMRGRARFYLESRVETLIGDLRHVRYEVQRYQTRRNIHNLTQDSVQSVLWFQQPQQLFHIP